MGASTSHPQQKAPAPAAVVGLERHLQVSTAALQTFKETYQRPVHQRLIRQAATSMLSLKDASPLLEPGDLGGQEDGAWVTPDGSWLVAVRTRLPEGCTGRMVQWWFSWCDSPEKYQVWHPEDHVWCTWTDGFMNVPADDRRPGHHEGQAHIVTEHLGSSYRHQHLRVEFCDPAAFGLDRSRFLQGGESSGVLDCLCARVVVFEPGLGELYASHLCHCLRKGEDGIWEIRSRFWLGFDTRKVHANWTFPPKAVADFMANTSLIRGIKIPPARALALHQHSAEEFASLGSVLPALFDEYASPYWKGEASEM